MLGKKPDIEAIIENDGIKLKRRSRDFCLLCGSKPVMLGVFMPNQPDAFGGVQGKTRLIRYCLCATCQKKRDVQDLVEKVIMAEMAGGATHAE